MTLKSNGDGYDRGRCRRHGIGRDHGHGHCQGRRRDEQSSQFEKRNQT